MGHGGRIWRKNILLRGSPRLEHTHTGMSVWVYFMHGHVHTRTCTRTYTGMKEYKLQAGFHHVKSADEALRSEDVR